MFLGLASLPWIQKNYREGGNIKIPREATQAILTEIEAIASDDQAILACAEECLALVPELQGPADSKLPGLAFVPRPTDENDNWFHRISGRTLGPNDLAELGITA